MPTPTRTTQALQAVAPAHLENDEPLVMGLRVMLKGHALNTGLLVGGGLVGASAARSRMQTEAADAEASGVPVAQRMAYGLTDRRLLVWEQSAATNALGDFLGSVPLAEVEGVAFRKAFLGNRLTLRLASGELELMVAKVEKGQAFADALSARIASR